GWARASRLRARGTHLSTALDTCAARTRGDGRDGVGRALASGCADASRIRAAASKRALRAAAALAAVTAARAAGRAFMQAQSSGAEIRQFAEERRLPRLLNL